MPKGYPLAPPDFSGLDPEVCEGFVREYLLDRYDDAVAIPDCHREWWDWYFAPVGKGALAAPRGHAKSTSITFAGVLAEALFGEAHFFLIVTATEELVKNFIGELKKELQENEKLREDFSPEFLKETETEIIVRCANGVFRILGKGAEQKIRGIKWRGMRPDRVIGDDMETDESVENPDRRRKFRRWFQNALLQCGSRRTKYRIVGTVLHTDSLLENLLKRAVWNSKRYAAHNADFSEILWPEMFSRDRLVAIRSEFAADGNLEGYAQEYLNDPVDASVTTFKKQWMHPMSNDDRRFFQARKGRCFRVSCDLAISKKNHGDWTVMSTRGVLPDGIRCLVDVRRARQDGFEIIDQIFDLHSLYEPDMFLIEGGTILKSIEPFLNAEMNRRKIYPNIVEVPQPVAQDKKARSAGVQAQLRSGTWRFDKEAEWYPVFEDEFLRLPKTKYDDQGDTMSQFGMTSDQDIESRTDAELEDEDARAEDQPEYTSLVCGY